jgi:hypothetical protein
VRSGLPRARAPGLSPLPQEGGQIAPAGVGCGQGCRSRRGGCAVCTSRLGARARQARVVAARVDGPVSAATYAEIRKSGPCVYCGGAADTVEHITPLVRGGLEHPDNLVPACRLCNLSKGQKLLSEWIPSKVAHAVKASPKVAAVYAAITLDTRYRVPDRLAGMGRDKRRP